MNRRALLLSISGLLAGGPVFADAVKLRELYKKGGGFSDWAISQNGKRVRVEGFMAPPLKAESAFFVLTKIPMSVCPFCETEAEWPDDILAVYTKRTVEPVSFNVKIQVSGVLETGAYTDPETGFVSMLRLMDATYE